MELNLTNVIIGLPILLYVTTFWLFVLLLIIKSRKVLLNKIKDLINY
jgi:hypothetical protein